MVWNKKKIIMIYVEHESKINLLELEKLHLNQNMSYDLKILEAFLWPVSPQPEPWAIRLSILSLQLLFFQILPPVLPLTILLREFFSPERPWNSVNKIFYGIKNIILNILHNFFNFCKWTCFMQFANKKLEFSLNRVHVNSDTKLLPIWTCWN